jgi:hypothetical protein
VLPKLLICYGLRLPTHLLRCSQLNVTHTLAPLRSPSHRNQRGQSRDFRYAANGLNSTNPGNNVPDAASRPAIGIYLVQLADIWAYCKANQQTRGRRSASCTSRAVFGTLAIARDRMFARIGPCPGGPWMASSPRGITSLGCCSSTMFAGTASSWPTLIGSYYGVGLT